MINVVRNLIEKINDYSWIISPILSIITFICGFIFHKLVKVIERHKLNQFLMLNKKLECKILLPSYQANIFNNTNLTEVYTAGDIKASSNIIELINKTGIYKSFLANIYEKTYTNLIANNNLFCIGGFSTNDYTYDLFQQFFPFVKFYMPQEQINNYTRPTSCFIVDENMKGFSWGDSDDEKYMVNSDERYIILIRLLNTDFNIKNHGTVHIIFGQGIIGTLVLSKYMLNNYKDIFAKTKHHSHYFIVFKFKAHTQLIDMNSYKDLTDIVFK